VPNTLAYYDMTIINDVKYFTVQAPGARVVIRKGSYEYSYGSGGLS
jgi:hypothetical protein